MSFFDTLVAKYIDLEMITCDKDEIKVKFKMSEKHTQPYGLLHGGVTAFIAEEIMSMGSGLNVDRNKYVIVGVSLSCDHCGSARIGDIVTMTAKPRHRGRKTQVWLAEAYTDKNKLVSLCKMTAMNVPIEHKVKSKL